MKTPKLDFVELKIDVCEYNTEQEELLLLSNIMEKMSRYESELNDSVYWIWTISDEVTGCIVNGRERMWSVETKHFSLSNTGQ